MADTQHCPICKHVVEYSERYPRYVCAACAEQVTSQDGRPLSFGNEGIWGGFVGCYADTHEPYHSHECFIRGVPCYADEAHFGGIVIEPIASPSATAPTLRLRRNLSAVKLELDLDDLWRIFGLLAAHDQADLLRRYLVQLHNEEFLDEDEAAALAAHYHVPPPRLR